MHMKTGFTLVEMLVVMTIIALLLAIATPRYIRAVDESRETVLRQNLGGIRRAIDQFAADRGTLPRSLAELVEAGYLRDLPLDPVTGRRDTWQAVTAAASEDRAIKGAFGQAGAPAVPSASLADVRSGAPGRARDGSVFRDW